MYIFNKKMVNVKKFIKPPKLDLKPVPNKEGLRYGFKSNGQKYSVREDRSRYFFPEEWILFYSNLNKSKRPLFNVLINTGARIEEALNIRPKDFDWERKTLTLTVTKTKAAKKESIGRKRTFVISSQLVKDMKKYINKNKISDDARLFTVSKSAVWRMMKRVLIKSEFKDYYNFSLHNIRKTHGNYLKALGIPAEEICLRLGHDMNTYLKHYGSATIFDRKDKLLMIKILGDVYGFR